MSKQFKILDKSAIVEEEQLANFDWNLCVICQKSTSEKLQSPVEATKRPAELCAGYLTFEESIKRCKALNWFPVKLNLEILTDDTDHGTADILQKRKAKWHKSCRMKFSDLKIERQEKRKRSGDSIDESCRPTAEVKVTRQSCTASTKTMTSECFFCDEASGDLHQASTFNIDRRVRECALELQDTVLLAKLSAGDLISLEAVYHVNCLVALYNRARKRIPHFEEENLDEMYNGIVFAELVSFIEESRLETNIAPVFKLADLTKMYTSRLEQLISTSKESVKCNQTHLKNRILSVFPELQAHRQGREVLLIFSTDVGDAIKQATKNNYDDEGMILAKAASIVRRDMFQTKYKFSGTFEYNCQQSSVPESLKSLIRMIVGGPDIETQSSNSIDAQTTLTISQLLQFNCTIRRRKDSQSTFHSSDREPPLPIYLGLMIHAETRKRGLIDKLYSLGLCISYDRIMHLSTALGNSICDRFNADNVVCPGKLKRGVFTTAAVDNIDHNPSSNTSQGSLHGTAISLFQHPTLDNEGEERFSTAIDDTFKGNILKPLPESYAIVPPVTLPKEPAEVPVLGGKFISDCEEFPSDMNLEYRWLNYVKDKISGDDFEDLNISWAAFHAIRLQSDVNKPLDICSLLPLFQEEAKSIAMIRHSMTIVMQCVHFLNQGQKAVIACDQPLYALAKTIQWNWPDRFGESHITVMFGGLHIEIAAFRTIGDWLQNSGWVNALSEANIASSGTADSFLKASHVSRTRHAHQITACVLHILMNRAYITYIEENDLDVGTVTFDDWKAEREIESPQFHFWSITLKLELTILIFVRSLREGNFQMYKDSLTKIVPWFFALDHPNYARWIPVHLRDMMCLTETSPGVASEFEAGHFVVNKTSNLFSSIAIDHAHEQNNKLVKGDGGAIGLTENMSQLLRWMVSGPEMARVVNEFESSQELLKHIQAKGPNIRHHEQVNSIQKTFHNQVKSLIQVFEEMGNPFLESSEDLLVLDTRDIADPRVTETVRHIERIGKEQFQEFVSERLEKQIKPLAIPIKQNKFPLFSRQELRTESKEKQQINSLKQNISLFSQLYVSCQVRNGNLDDFFRHENQPYPPSLSQFGKLRLGTKSDLLSPLEKLVQTQNESPNVDTVILDGAALVNMLKPRGCRTFEDFSHQIFLPYVLNVLRSCTRVDVIWDEYFPDSLKSCTRSKRGKGVRRRVQPGNQIPGNWESFLRVDENKKELFILLAEQLMTLDIVEDKQIVTTKTNTVLCRHPHDTALLEPCTHEEADTRIMIHVADSVSQGLQKIMIKTVDTDVVIIAISVVHQIAVSELWVAFGTGKNFKYLSAHEIANTLGPSKSQGLLFFHAFTGCDQVSSFANRGKKTAWDTWSVLDTVTDAFASLSKKPSHDIVYNALPLIERFVILMYDRTSECEEVNSARKELFTRKGRVIDNVPPTSAALLEHVKRAVYQAGYIWGQSLIPSPESTNPGDWGWGKTAKGIWEPIWSMLQQASKCCVELIKCSCKSELGCRGRCKCMKAEMKCTALCKCGGDCDRQ